MNKNHWSRLIGLALVAGVLLSSAGCSSFFGLPTLPPLATQALALPTDTPEPTPAATPTFAYPPPESQPETVYVPYYPAPVGRGTCGGEGVMTVLVLAEGPQDDPAPAVIRLVRVDFMTPGVSVVSMPSDLWVNTQALPGLEAGTLKQVYEQARGAAPAEGKVASQLATQYLTVALEENFGFTPDHYLTINRLAFTDLVKTLGGIALLVYAQAGSTGQGLEIIDAGLQALAALGGLDFGGLLQDPGLLNPDQFVSPERRGALLELLRQQMSKPENWARLAALIHQLYYQLATDLSLEQLFTLSCMVQAAGDNLSVVGVPPGMISQDAEGRQIPDLEQIRQLIEAVMAEY